MNSPSHDASYDQRRLHELTSAVLDGTATKDQRQELTSILQRSATARDEFLALADLHAILATDLTSVSSAQQAPTTSRVDRPNRVSPGSRFRWTHLAGLAAFAACLTFVVIQFASRNPSIPANVEFAVVAQTTEAVWSSEHVDVGDRLGPGAIRLKSGLVRFEFDSGVEVTLKGPSEYEFVSPVKTNLKSGLLTANVPPGAEGFTVATPAAEVVDLGTSFGIHLRDDGNSNVSVFDGEVEVAIRDETKKRLLTEGESIQIASDRTVQVVDLDPQPFEKLWPIASGIAGSTNTIQFVPPWPRQMRFVNSDSAIFIGVERRSVALSEALRVNISEAGEYIRRSELTPRELPVGELVRSYSLHYAPLQRAGPRRASRISGSITFARPILGLIVQHEELLRSSRLFSRRGKGEANRRRELQLTGDLDGDGIKLSEDRRTVTLDLISPGRSSDLVRVIVEDGGRRNRQRQLRHRRQPFASAATNARSEEASP